MTSAAPADQTSDLILTSPVAQALAVLGDRWVGLILRDVFLGVRRFEALRRRSGAARGTLAARLKGLVESGILYRRAYQELPLRYEYRLTAMGLDLYPYVLAVWDWETRWSDEHQIPPELKHSVCGQVMRPQFRCGHCREPVHMRAVTFEKGPQTVAPDRAPPRVQRRTPSREISEDGVDRRFFHVLDIIGDRWTGLVVAALFFGLNRYDEIAAALGIATNILADRLKLLVAAGVLQRVPYQDMPLRHEYKLTKKGADLYTNALQMHEWANHWLLDGQPSPLKLRHTPCRAELRSEVVCSHCQQPLNVSEVSFIAHFDPAAKPVAPTNDKPGTESGAKTRAPRAKSGTKPSAQNGTEPGGDPAAKPNGAGTSERGKGH